jgi:hypothetical protein
MTIHTLSLIGRTPADPVSDQSPTDYSRYSDDQLIAARERLGRHLQPALQPGASGHESSAAMEDDLERITEELIRRARSRHPSSFRSVP